MSELSVIVSHPAKQGNVYHRARAAAVAGFRTRFLTGLYYRPDRFPYSLVRLLPKRRRDGLVTELRKRRIQGLNDADVVSLLGPILETVLRPRGRYRQWSEAHDRLASWWLSRHSEFRSDTIVHCFQDSALETLKTAKSRGMTTVVEMTLPPLLDTDPGEIGEIERINLPGADRLKAEIGVADFVIVQSEYSARVAMKLAAPADRVIRLHLGVDTERFSPRQAPRSPGPVRILFLGGTSRRKGVHHLVEAWGPAGIPDAELLIGGNRVQGLDALSGSLPVNSRLLGFIPDEQFPDLIRNVDIVVNPSLSEGGSNVVYEALASGVPCVISQNASSAIRDGKEGFVVGVGDTTALRHALQLLCSNETLRIEMGHAARRRAESLSWDNYAVNLADIYRRIARSGDSVAELAEIHF